MLTLYYYCMLWKKTLCRGCTGLYVGLIRWLRLLPSLGLYGGCTAGNVFRPSICMFLWSCAYRRLARLCSWASRGQRAHEKTREPRRRAEGGQEEARRRAVEDWEEARKRATTKSQSPLFHDAIFHLYLFEAILLSSVQC